MARVAKTLGSNVATVRRWYDTLGLHGMTSAGATKAIREAKAEGGRPSPKRETGWSWDNRY